MNHHVETWDDVERLYRNGVFCPDAWVGLSSSTDGKWRLCCYSDPVGGSAYDTSIAQTLGHPERLQVQNNMLAGDRSDACRRCMDMQDKGIRSRRDRLMQDWRETPEVQQSIIDAINQSSRYLDRLDIKFTGNQCNLKCFTCNPGNSSSLGVQAVQMGEKPTTYQPVKNPFGEFTHDVSLAFWDSLDQILPRTRILNFTGGEPFMMDSYWDVMDRAIQSGAATEMELHLSSNMSVMKWGRRSVLDYFSRFKRVRLQASVDAFGDFNDYIRYPSRFGLIIDNIKRVQDSTSNVDIAVSSVVSALSVKTIPMLHEHMQQLGLWHYFSNVLDKPNYQRVEWLPDQVKQSYLDNEFASGEPIYGDIIRILQRPEDLGKHQQMIARCSALDTHRGTDARRLWPEFRWSA